MEAKTKGESMSDLLDGFVQELDETERDFFRVHMIARPPRRVTAELFGMSLEDVRLVERRLREKALRYLKRMGYLNGPPPRRLTVNERIEVLS